MTLRIQESDMGHTRCCFMYRKGVQIFSNIEFSLSILLYYTRRQKALIQTRTECEIVERTKVVPRVDERINLFTLDIKTLLKLIARSNLLMK